MAHRVKARLEAMGKQPPSSAQLAYLKTLGDTQEAPATMAAASQRIEALKSQKGQQ
jgi:hypothetical protein